MAGSWYQLLDIIKEDAQEQAYWESQPPMACPNDGEPLVTGPDGQLFCKFDGYRPQPGDHP
jgi:hypothetical protein